MCNPMSSTLCDFTLEKFNKETEFYITKHMPKSSSGTNQFFDCHSNLVTTTSSRMMLDTTFGYMPMEIDCGGKPNYTSYGCPMANWKGHETHNPNHMNESLLSEVDWGAHDSSVFLFLVNIDYDAKPNE